MVEQVEAQGIKECRLIWDSHQWVRVWILRKVVQCLLRISFRMVMYWILMVINHWRVWAIRGRCSIRARTNWWSSKLIRDNCIRIWRREFFRCSRVRGRLVRSRWIQPRQIIESYKLTHSKPGSTKRCPPRNANKHQIRLALADHSASSQTQISPSTQKTPEPSSSATVNTTTTVGATTLLKCIAVFQVKRYLLQEETNRRFQKYPRSVMRISQAKMWIVLIINNRISSIMKSVNPLWRAMAASRPPQAQEDQTKKINSYIK